MNSNAPATTLNLSEIVRRAADRIRDPSRWTQNTNARDAHSRQTSPLDPSATCWCAEGAVAVECPGSQYERSARANEIMDAAGWNLAYVNDNQGHSAILRRLDEVATKLEAHGR